LPPRQDRGTTGWSKEFLEAGKRRLVADAERQSDGRQVSDMPAEPGAPDALRYTFAAALGSTYPAADPNPGEYALEYPTKIKLELKRGPTGGCG
jgi:hypothetical protein